MALLFIAKLPSIFKITSLSNRALTSFAQVRAFSLTPKTARLLNPVRSNVVFRTFFQFFRKPTANQWRVIDGMPDDCKLIYKNTMYRYLFSAQIFSSISAVIVCIIVIMDNWEFKKFDAIKWGKDSPPAPIENEGLIYVTSFILLCVMLQVMVSKMPLRIYSYPGNEKYHFVFYGSLPTTKRRLICKVKDVIKLDESGILPWKDSRYEVRNKQRVIMLENFFRRPADLNIMLGYQKPPENYD